ncbi:MAG: endolytic transglycosylase MltG [Clostridia bacterium]|nr:endolytic transglycosylase MltG [Clostridia bacterium]
MKKSESEKSRPASMGKGKDQPREAKSYTREKQRAMAAPRRRRKKKTVNTGVVSALVKIAVFLVFIIVVSAFAGAFVISVGNDVFAFVKPEEPVSVTVPENATVEDISTLLHEAGIIKHPKIFVMYAGLKEDDGEFIAGEYEVSPQLNYDQLLSEFKYKFVRSIVRITIPEGYCVEDIIELFVSHGIGDREGFIRAINEVDYSEFRFVRELMEQDLSKRYYRLEGYLYPDTYDFYTDATPAQVVYKLLNNFDRKFKDVYYDRCAELGLTVDQVVTIASFIQEEAYYLEEFENVASVFHNRLNNPAAFPRLESDATAAYAIHVKTGKRPEKIVPADLEVDSPYNTYKNDGLPPGAISSPGYDAIVTAMYPAKTSYYYFYTKSDKRTVFSKTLAEHQAAIRADTSELPN